MGLYIELIPKNKNENENSRKVLLVDSLLIWFIASIKYIVENSKNDLYSKIEIIIYCNI